MQGYCAASAFIGRDANQAGPLPILMHSHERETVRRRLTARQMSTLLKEKDEGRAQNSQTSRISVRNDTGMPIAIVIRCGDFPRPTGSVIDEET
jgi:hypothetical protein